MFEKYWANKIRYYTNSRLPPWTNDKSRFLTHGGGFRLCSQASALGGFADLKHLARDFQSPGLLQPYFVRIASFRDATSKFEDIYII